MISKSDFFSPISGHIVDWTGFTVIIPSVSVANVPQLAVDLLISNLLQRNQAQLVGRIRSPCLRPIAGPNPYDIFSAHPSSSCEVYVTSAYRAVILQVRTPPYSETRKLFSQKLAEWIRDQGFGTILLLTSSFAQCLTELDLDNPGQVIKYMTGVQAAGSESEEVLQQHEVRPQTTNTPAGPVHIPGSGFGYSLFQILKEAGHNVVMLVHYCSEGDNRPDAQKLVRVVGNGLLGVEDVKWVEPVSWNNMFGSEIRSDIF